MLFLHLRCLPDVHIINLTSLLEHLAEKPGDQAGSYHPTEELILDFDRLLRLSKATELLDSVIIAKGDIHLIALGKTFADGSILARKEIFAIPIRHLLLALWMMEML